MPANMTKIGEDGRIVIPAVFRKKMGLKPGDELIILLEEDGIRLLTPQQGIKRAQALVRQYVPEGKSLVDELIQERRKESLNG